MGSLSGGPFGGDERDPQSDSTSGESERMHGHGSVQAAVLDLPEGKSAPADSPADRISRSPRLGRAPVAEPDVIVIGSGPSGAAAALALVERGVPVTLLESGPRPSRGFLVRAFGRNLYRRWARKPDRSPKYHASGDADTLWFHELLPGGMSNYWTAAVPRFAPEDFEDGSRFDDRHRWPVSYADLEPYYARLEPLLGVVADSRAVPMLPSSVLTSHRQLPADWQRISGIAAARGQGITPVPLANGSDWMVRRSGANFNSFDQIVQPLTRSHGFRLMLGAHATALHWDARKEQVDSVVYLDQHSQVERRMPARAVVVAAGPLMSAKLLLQSRSADFPDGLGNTHGLLGRYLHDHPHDWSILKIDQPLTRLVQSAYVTRVPYADARPLHAAAIIVGPATQRERYLSTVPIGKTSQFGMTTFATMVPRAENFISLHPTLKDSFGEPLLDICLRYDDSAAETIRHAHDRFVSILGDAGYRADVICDAPKLIPGQSVHFGGTVRMHASDEHGMVNGWNQLHAVDNVFVVDASSFTTGVEKNPTLTAMALALRAGHHLADILGFAASPRG